MAESASQERLAQWAVVVLLVLQGALVADVAWRTGCTTDEHHYFNSGRILTRHGYAHVGTMLQGPLPLRANQLLVREFPRGGYEAGVPGAQELLFRGRLPTLLFLLPATWIVHLWSRRLFGSVGGLLTLTALCLHPLWLSYGALMLVDAQHASLLMVALFLLARHLERPSFGRMAAFAAAGAAAVATKYLALVALGPAALLALVASTRAAPCGRRWRAGLRALATLACVGLAMLQACYRAGASEHCPPSEYRSAGLRAAQSMPVVGQALALLPTPLLEGLDYQREQAEGTWSVFLDGESSAGSVRYYPLVFLRRTPEILLLLLVPALFLLRRARLRGDLVALGLPLGAMLGYLSFGPSMQLGVRYALVVVPAGCLVLGALGTWSGFLRRAWVGPLAALGVALFLVADLVRNGPDWLAYFNASSGGQARAYRHFRDTNCDFGQHELDKQAWFASFGPRGVTPLGAHAGGRFGRVAVRPLRLGRHPPSEGAHPLEWALVGPPLAHLGASWYVFDVTREALEAVLQREESRVHRRALVVALLAEGERGEARRVAGPLGLRPRDPLRKLLAGPALEPAQERAMWRAVGREDLAGEASEAGGERELPAPEGPRLRAARERAADLERYRELLAE